MANTKSKATVTLLQNTQLLFDLEGAPTYFLVPVEDIKNLSKLSSSDQETLEILSNSNLVKKLFARSKSAKNDNLLSLDELKNALQGKH